MTKIYGHRGSKGDYPENSMLAFKKAIEAGVHGMELDIHLTKDHEIVVIHDATLDRTTTGSGYVRDYTLAELSALSVGAKFSEFPNYNQSWDEETIPTLSEALQLFKASGLEVNIELKTYEFTYPGIEEKVLEVVNQSGYDQDKIIYSSFHLPTLLRIKQAEKAANIAYLVGFNLPLPADYFDVLNLEMLHPGKELVLNNPAAWKEIATRLRVWTVNDALEMKQLLDLGVAAIITDYPEVAMGLLED